MAPSSSSGLTFKLHPLVMLNISDHFTRVKTQLSPPAASCATGNGSSNADATFLQNPRVYGCVIGLQRGRTVEIFNSFELLFDSTTDTLDRSFLEKKQELCKFADTRSLYRLTFVLCCCYTNLWVFSDLDKKVFPDFYVLGWYSTGSDATESDMHIHKAVSVASLFNMNGWIWGLIVLIVWGFLLQLMDINESPVYVLLNPAINHAQKDLPVTIYESGKLVICIIDYLFLLKIVTFLILSLIVFKTWRIPCHWWSSSVDFRSYKLHYWGVCFNVTWSVIYLCDMRVDF